MDLRVLVLTGDHELGELVRSQVENLGCRVTMAATYDECIPALGWAEAAVVDVAGGGMEDLYRLRIDTPLIRVLTIAQTDDEEARAIAAGSRRVLREPFSIADVIDAVRAMGKRNTREVIDLTTGERHRMPDEDDAPWWATR
ncbi:MAG: hypothetical protein ABWZ76_03470 [Acidimicrobiales bacterium]